MPDSYLGSRVRYGRRNREHPQPFEAFGLEFYELHGVV